MKILHTADLHLGKLINGYRMTEDQEYILKKIVEIAKKQEVQAVLLSGDIYDRRIPSEEAVNLFDRFLSRLNSEKIKTFIISGNHDSAERLSFGESLMEKEGIYISHPYDGTVKSVNLQDEYGEVEFFLLPFVKPIHVRAMLEDDSIETYTDAVEAVIKNLDIDKNKRNVMLSHQFVTGAKRSESEEISIGGLDNVDYEVYDDFDYVALGHLHGGQKCGRETVRYAGTPIKYSFTEHGKSVTIVDFKEKGNTEIEKIELVPMRDMREICGTFEELIENGKNDLKKDDYISAVLLDEREVPEAYYRLKDVYGKLMVISYDNKRTANVSSKIYAEEEKKNPLDYANELFEKQNGKAMSENQQKIIESVLRKAAEGGIER